MKVETGKSSLLLVSETLTTDPATGDSDPIVDTRVLNNKTMCERGVKNFDSTRSGIELLDGP